MKEIAVLLVDDQPKNLVAMAAALEGLDAEVVTASSGTVALRRLLEREFALVLLDVQMPGMDGFQTAELIRRRARTRETPLVFVTALQKADEHVARGYEVGAADYVFKPVRPEVLRQKAKVFVELARQRVQLERQASKLRLSEARYRGLVEGMPAIVYLCGLDPLASPEYLSPQVEGVLGHPPATWLTDPAMWSRRLHIADRERVLAEYARCVAARVPFRAEYQVTGADGRMVWFHDEGQVVSDELGRPAHVQGVRLDITDRRRAEEAAHRAGELLRATLASLPVPVFRLDEWGKPLDLNAEAVTLFGWRLDEIQDRSLAIVPEGCRDEFAGMLRRVCGGEEIRGAEFAAMSRDGTLVPLLLYLAPVRVGGLDSSAIVVTMVDIREQRRVADQLRAARAASEVARADLESFSYSVAHDLRAPLRAISGFGRALQEEFGGGLGPAGGEYVHKMVSAAGRMSQLIDDLLDLARFSGHEVHRVPVDLSVIAREILHAFAGTAPGRRLTMAVADGLSAEADPGLVRALLTNLLGNAWKFTSHHEAATIEVGFDLENNAFFVRDDGAGFPMEQSDDLFLPLRRLHAQREFEGTGIGLAIVSRIVQRHGGRVWARGEPEKGATFWFSLGQPDVDAPLPGS